MREHFRSAAAAALLSASLGATAVAWADAAFTAAMAGRKAATLDAVQSLQEGAPAERADVARSFEPYAALVRFGLWDELIARLAPDADGGRAATGGYLYGRGVALAARGRIAEAEATLAQLSALEQTMPAQEQTLRAVLAVAVPVVGARIAASANRGSDAVALLAQAVAAEDRLPGAPVPLWFFPVRHLLGAQLLEERDAAQAERIYREDLVRNPVNGWSLFGLAAALRAQGRTSDAAKTQAAFLSAWRSADVRLVASAFWFAGPDTTSCECQREDAGMLAPNAKLRRPEDLAKAP